LLLRVTSFSCIHLIFQFKENCSKKPEEDADRVKPYTEPAQERYDSQRHNLKSEDEISEKKGLGTFSVQSSGQKSARNQFPLEAGETGYEDEHDHKVLAQPAPKVLPRPEPKIVPDPTQQKY